MHAVTSFRGRIGRASGIDERVTGREAAFESLYRAQLGRVLGYLRYRVGDATLAEDLAAEVFVRAWARLDRLEDPDRAVPWLLAVARNLALDHLRRRRGPVPLDGLAPGALPAVASPEEGVLTDERLAALGRALAALGEREREVLGLRFAADLRNREIARVIGTSEGNVAKIVYRALRTLAEQLAEPYQEGGTHGDQSA